MRKKRRFHCQKCHSPCEIYKKGKSHRALICPSCGILATNPAPFSRPFFSISGQKERLGNVKNVLLTSTGIKKGSLKASTPSRKLNKALETAAAHPFATAGVIAGGATALRTAGKYAPSAIRTTKAAMPRIISKGKTTLRSIEKASQYIPDDEEEIYSYDEEEDEEEDEEDGE